MEGSRETDPDTRTALQEEQSSVARVQEPLCENRTEKVPLRRNRASGIRCVLKLKRFPDQDVGRRI